MPIPVYQKKPVGKPAPARKPAGFWGRFGSWWHGNVTARAENDVQELKNATERYVVAPAEHLYAVGKQDVVNGARVIRNTLSEHAKAKTKKGSGTRFSGYGNIRSHSSEALTASRVASSGGPPHELRDGENGWEKFKQEAEPFFFSPLETQAEANAPWYQNAITNSPHTLVGDTERVLLGLSGFANDFGPGLRKLADVPTQIAEGLGTGMAGVLLNPFISHAGPNASPLVNTLAGVALNEQASAKDHLGLNPVRPTDLPAQDWAQLNKTYPNSRAGAQQMIADTMIPLTPGYGSTWRAIADEMAAEGGVASDIGQLFPGTMAALGDPQAWANNPGGNTAMAVSLLAGAKGGGEAADAAAASPEGAASPVDAAGDAGASRTGIGPYIDAYRQIAAARAQRSAPADGEVHGEASDPVAEAGPTASPEKAQPATPSGNHYSVAYHMKLDPADWGRSDKVHFNRANAALDAAIQSDPHFAALMEELIPGVSNTVSRVNGRDTPDGWTWHHAIEPGVMQLVPSEQHTAGSIFWDTFHPGGVGGYALWARPAGAPQR